MLFPFKVYHLHNFFYSKRNKDKREYHDRTLFITFLSSWPSNLMMLPKYVEGSMSAVIVFNTVSTESFSAFLMTIGTLECFLLDSTSCNKATTPKVSKFLIRKKLLE